MRHFQNEWMSEHITKIRFTTYLRHEFTTFFRYFRIFDYRFLVHNYKELIFGVVFKVCVHYFLSNFYFSPNDSP